MNPKAREHRFRRLKEMGCIVCFADGSPGTAAEIHHLNLGGKAGQKRRGDEYTIPLCRWHHQGQAMNGFSLAWHHEHLGPSLKLHSREFRKKYGDDDSILATVNRIMHTMDTLAYGGALQ